MKNQYDTGIQQDFDNMTEELGTEFTIYHQDYSSTYEGQEGEKTEDGYKYKETGSIQELDSKHEVVASGEFNVGDLRVTLKHNTIAKPEAYIEWNSSLYKIINLTKARGLRNDVITHVVAYGKKVPNR